ncbi:MAG: LytTR family DNA-binding domain-containing protein [Lachnospiraceae bacterium]|nr:LytTR family DNA-binding domain-containing protein [Lachnospiraceae bacterium]
MLNIGICDDGVNTCAFFELTVRKYAERKLLQVQVECWNSGETLKHALMNGSHIDILFLDIEMYGLSGIDIGKYIRNQMDDHCMQIVYISGKSFHAKDLFQVQPMDFLEKPITDVQIEAALELAVKLTGKWNGRFEYKVGKEYYYLPYRDILYFTSYGRMVRIMLADSYGDVKKDGKGPNDSKEDRTVEFYGKIKEVLGKLPVGFQQIHHSYIINTMYVRRYQYDQIELVTGCVLPISKSYRKEVRHQILQEG